MKGLDIKTKLHMYKRFGRVNSKSTYNIIHGFVDARTRLLFRSGTHGLNRHTCRGGEVKAECSICGAECESVAHVLSECPAYTSCREVFKAKFKELLGDSFEQLCDDSVCSR